jgi:hypothetical protein
VAFLYLTTRGRVSGEPRQIEIWFVTLDAKHYVIAETRERAGWVKNLRVHPQVTFSIGTRKDTTLDFPATLAHARVVDPSAEPELAAEVRAAMDAKYDWSDGLIVELAPSR